MERENFDVRLDEATAEVGEVLDARDRVAKARRGHPIDEVDQVVLHAPHRQLMDDMQNEWPGVGGHEWAAVLTGGGGALAETPAPARRGRAHRARRPSSPRAGPIRGSRPRRRRRPGTGTGLWTCR